MRHRSRLLRLEEYQRRRLPPNHFVMSVRVPWDLPDGMDQETWLREGVRCACSQLRCPEMRIGLALPEKAPSPLRCPEMRIGLALPEKAPSPQAWCERAQQCYAQRRVHDA
jgi:hypothetical protein